MGAESKREREERALDALLVSALRRAEKDGDEIDPKRLPKLSEAERTAMNALGSDFMQRLLAGNRPIQKAAEQEQEGQTGETSELALAGSDMGCGLNRAEELNDESTEEIDRQKREIIERKKRERQEGGGKSG
jgi:hypothetical protein